MYQILDEDKETRNNLKMWLNYAKWTYSDEHKLDMGTVPYHIISNKKVADVMRKYNGRPMLFRMKKGTYAAHTDRTRTAALNIQINSSGILEMQQEDQEWQRINFINHWLLMDVTKMHRISRISKSRIILTIGFYGPTYQQLLQELMPINELSIT